MSAVPIDVAALFAGLAVVAWLASAWRSWQARAWVLQARIWAALGAIFAAVAWLLG